MKCFKLFLCVGLFSMALSAKASIEVHAHRGSRGTLPENTLPSFEAGIEAGADLLELDLQVSSDGFLVVHHDYSLNPEICLNSDGSEITDRLLIHSLTLKEIKQLDCGTLPHPGFPRQKQVPGTKVPLLTEVFGLIHKSPHPNAAHVGVNIELKIDPEHAEKSVSPEELGAKVAKEVRASGLLERITVQSFDPRPLAVIKRIAPEIRIAFLVIQVKPDSLKKAQELQAETISPAFENVTAAFVKDAHDSRLKVIPWTVNKPQDWDNLAKMGVDGFISDYPSDLVKHLEKVGK